MGAGLPLLPSIILESITKQGITLGKSREIFSKRWETGGMTQFLNSPKGKVVISLHKLYVEVEHEANYPDQLTDLGNRAFEIFTASMDAAKQANCDIRAYEFDYDEYEDDE